MLCLARFVVDSMESSNEEGGSDPSGSGQVDMLTGPVAAARADVATGAWAKSKHDMYLVRGSVEA